jgi:hypothetical protein
MEFFARSSNTNSENIGMVTSLLYGTPFAIAAAVALIAVIIGFFKRLFS